ncbi:MAG TPA: hypothetical protein VFA61_00520 [Candidatus Udaeobacter sp.]|nr:hypothetical protein [Candidatus Udaeobacter sp.]
MASILWLVTVLIVVLATTPAVAHALELPGKMRLSKGESVTAELDHFFEPTMQAMIHGGLQVRRGFL